MSDITETLKRKLDELDLDRRLNEFVDQAEKTAQTALRQAGEFAHQHREDIDQLLGNTTEKINQKTQAKYADRLDKMHGQVIAGVERLADKRHSDPGLDS